MQVIPLLSRALATARMSSLGATRENSSSASLLGPANEGSPGWPVAGGVPTSLTTDFSEALVDQRNRHGPLAYGGRTALDRPAPDIASCEQPWQTCFER